MPTMRGVGTGRSCHGQREGGLGFKYIYIRNRRMKTAPFGGGPAEEQQAMTALPMYVHVLSTSELQVRAGTWNGRVASRRPPRPA